MSNQATLPLVTPRNIIFLNMNAKTAAAVIAARPELKQLKQEGTRVFMRKLGMNGDASVKSLQDGELAGATVVGFSIPVNVAAKAERSIEIPIGKTIERRKLGDDLNESEMTLVAKGLAEYVRIPLKAYMTSIVALTEGTAVEAEDEDGIDF